MKKFKKNLQNSFAWLLAKRVKSINRSYKNYSTSHIMCKTDATFVHAREHVGVLTDFLALYLYKSVFQGHIRCPSRHIRLVDHEYYPVEFPKEKYFS